MSLKRQFNIDSQLLFCVVWLEMSWQPFVMYNVQLLTNEMPLLMETRSEIFFKHDTEPPHFGQLQAYLNQPNENRWAGRRGPVPWPPRSPDLTPLDFY
jgi:hypothetical protein